MILITAGTVAFEFERLMAIAEAVAKFYPKEKIIIQPGTSNYHGRRHSGMKVERYLSLSEMKRYYSKAAVIISAAGEASVGLMMRLAQKVPILVPRRKQFGEQVDDQQVEIAAYFEKIGLARVAETGEAVLTAMVNLPVKSRQRKAWSEVREAEKQKLITYLRERAE
jgi:UDP-N-acetylglucosamine transferase subunit ALG13